MIKKIKIPRSSAQILLIMMNTIIEENEKAPRLGPESQIEVNKAYWDLYGALSK